jgi:hypothetical protein
LLVSFLPFKAGNNNKISLLGTGMSKGSEAKRFVAELQQIAERSYNNLFTSQQLFQLGKGYFLSISYLILFYFIVLCFSLFSLFSLYIFFWFFFQFLFDFCFPITNFVVSNRYGPQSEQL